MTACQSARESRVTAPVLRSRLTRSPSRRMPALFTSPVRPPIASCAKPTNAPMSASLPTSSRRTWILPRRPAASSARLASAASFTSPGDDLPARLREAVRVVPAEALRGAGHDDLGVFESHR